MRTQQMFQSMTRATAAAKSGVEPLFLIDGFPRSMDNVQEYEKQVTSFLTIQRPLLNGRGLVQIGPIRRLIYLSCTDEVMRERLLSRSVSGSLSVSWDRGPACSS